MDAERELDVVVFGATGFVGRLVAGYLAEHAPEGTRIGLAGRSEERLTQGRAGLGAGAAGCPLLVADSEDVESLVTMAGAAVVGATTVGPSQPRGLALVGACAEAGTDYVDLTGEVLFERDSADRYHEGAAESGARIVHGGGFDSIPSDLGVHFLYETVKADDGGELEDPPLVVPRLRGGVRGGGLAGVPGLRGGASGGPRAGSPGQIDGGPTEPARRRRGADPDALSPDRAAEPDL